MILHINGNHLIVADEMADKNLLEYLREDLDLTGTKKSCGVGICGSCNVLVDGEAKPSCHFTVGEVADKELMTIEGFTASDGSLHPLQQAFMDHGAIQCGFCIPGMVLTAHAFLLKNSSPTRDQIRRAITPNLCRCTGYQQIIDAIEASSEYYRTNKATLESGEQH
jgi:aerobic-type carbon monoxide dehydrogenase small subunit (CoxS/CutS family)